jgi:hypothetical protein
MEPVCTFPPHPAVVIPLALSVFREGSKVPRALSFPLALAKEGRLLRARDVARDLLFLFLLRGSKQRPSKTSGA